jgi:ADP-L-glycero-D-manno-heptose 6-epimerase
MNKAIQYSIPIKYASSASIYGNCFPNYNPINLYALSKLQVDLWVENNINRFRQIQGFRYFNVFGAGEENKGFQASPISKFINESNKFGKISIFEGSENFRRDFIWVEDIVNIVLENSRGSGIYDLGSCNSMSFKEVANLISRKYGGEIVEIEFPLGLKGQYQLVTKSQDRWENYQFKTVGEFLELN